MTRYKLKCEDTFVAERTMVALFGHHKPLSCVRHVRMSMRELDILTAIVDAAKINGDYSAAKRPSTANSEPLTTSFESN